MSGKRKGGHERPGMPAPNRMKAGGQLSRWFIPGLGIKRWIGLAILSAAMISAFIMRLSMMDDPAVRQYAFAALAGSVILLGISTVKIIKFIDNIAKIAKEGHLEEYFEDARPHPHLPKIVMLGGGTGLSTLLRGVREHGDLVSPKNLSAIVTVADDGGSSGRLREEMNILPPGDIRNCLIALSTEEPLLAKLFQYRFREGTGLSGHSFGNLFIAAMTEVTGDFVKTIKESSKVLAVSGKVLPSTVTPLSLRARYADGTVVNGESQISYRHGKTIKEIEIVPRDAEALPEAIAEIDRADAIIIGPGSLFTSLVPNLLIGGIRDALRRSKAIKIYICNVMTQPGETDGFDAADHLDVLRGILGPDCIDFVVVSDVDNATAELLERYKAQSAHPVASSIEKLAERGVRVVRSDLMSYRDFLRHDPQKLADCVIEIIRKHGGHQ